MAQSSSETIFSFDEESESLLALGSPVAQAVYAAWKEATEKGLIKPKVEDTTILMRTIIEALAAEEQGSQPSEMTMNVEGELMGFSAASVPGRSTEAQTSKTLRASSVTAMLGNTRVRFGTGTDAVLALEGGVAVTFDDEPEDFGLDMNLLDEDNPDGDSDVGEEEAQEEPMT